MKIATISIVASLLLVNAVFAKPASQVTETNSLSKAMLEMVAQAHPVQGKVERARLDTHESQKMNSLLHAVLAIQGVKAAIRINSDSEVDYKPYSLASEKDNSLGRGALAEHQSHFE